MTGTRQLPETATHTRTLAQRFVRLAVLALPLVLVNAAAIYGQVQWAQANIFTGNYTFAILFAATIESIAVYLAYEAHSALTAGDAAFRLRIASYLVAGLVGVLNYSHFAGPGYAPTATALAFGGLSASSPWLWSIRSRSLRRDQLRALGLIDPRSAHFAVAKWVNFPWRTLGAYRWSVDHGVQEERAAWEAYRRAQRRRQAGVTVDAELDQVPEFPSLADALRHAFTELGSYDVPAALAWLSARGIEVNRSHAYQVARKARDEGLLERRPSLVAVTGNGGQS